MPAAIYEGEQSQPSLVGGRVEDNDDDNEEDDVVFILEPQPNSSMPPQTKQVHTPDGAVADEDEYKEEDDKTPEIPDPEGDRKDGDDDDDDNDSFDNILGPKHALDPEPDLSMLNLTYLSGNYTLLVE
ncbi:hypothetical protein L6452_22242 [Arctium lappa]|uniref:Uncharacterized protein n=1 Tax=Arctium lappa TaxID=4217 RepID=A0ACB9B016_ARCLA|nr:hypothetical protein L6452_22242 [Arctium lappa]